MEWIVSHWDQIAQVILAVFGAASAACTALAKFAKVTPNDKDDQYATQFKRYLGVVADVLSRLGLHPDSEHARKSKKKSDQ